MKRRNSRNREKQQLERERKKQMPVDEEEVMEGPRKGSHRRMARHTKRIVRQTRNQTARTATRAVPLLVTTTPIMDVPPVVFWKMEYIPGLPVALAIAGSLFTIKCRPTL